MGELHLEVIVNRLLEVLHESRYVGLARVAYREALLGTGQGRARVERILGGKEVFGALELEVRRDDEVPGARVEFVPGAAVPEAHRAAIAEGLLLEAQTGPRFGYPLVHARIRVVGGEVREGKKDSELGYLQAGAQALREALEAAGVELLEPLMAFEIQAPAEFASGVLNARSAEVRDVRAEGALRTISGTVPLSKMVGYSTAVRSLTQGRASFSMETAGFRGVPESELAVRGLVWT
jgi:elongation factor G